MPIELPNDQNVDEIILPNGANASEVRGPTGNVVWESIGSIMLYDEGDGEDEWVEGFSQGSGSVSKESDHLLIHIPGGDFTHERTWVIDDTVSLSEFSYVEIEWANDGDDSSQNSSSLIVSDDQDSNRNINEEALFTSGNFTRRIETLDISPLSDDYYIRVHARDSSSSAVESLLRVYRVELIP